jgi:hypothetical protein
MDKSNARLGELYLKLHSLALTNLTMNLVESSERLMTAQYSTAGLAALPEFAGLSALTNQKKDDLSIQWFFCNRYLVSCVHFLRRHFHCGQRKTAQL